jgi:hypothetical protein
MSMNQIVQRVSLVCSWSSKHKVVTKNRFQRSSQVLLLDTAQQHGMHVRCTTNVATTVHCSYRVAAS